VSHTAIREYGLNVTMPASDDARSFLDLGLAPELGDALAGLGYAAGAQRPSQP
jgi:hypothetical protein